MPSTAELVRLLLEPTEALTIEYKSWLDIENSSGKANLAKAAIAIANEGGGIIVLGMRSASGSELKSHPRPDQYRPYDQDLINAAINNYADPHIHCELAMATHPQTNTKHAFVIVPGGAKVPIMSSRDSPGAIARQRCYVRKPGPKSEEPFTSEEWRGVLERCLQARRDDMLDAIRNIVHGSIISVGQTSAPEQDQKLNSFVDNAQQRWRQLINDLPQDDPRRMPFGHYSLAFRIHDIKQAESFQELRHHLSKAREIRYTGWGPFVEIRREGSSPSIVGDTIEAWLGADGEAREPQHCDFWRASRDGLLYLQRGYDEDGVDDVTPGTMLDVTLPIWRVSEALLFVSRLSRLFAENALISVEVSYVGLRNRELSALNRSVYMSRGKRSADESAHSSSSATASQIDENIVEVTRALLSSLYERFDFFEISTEAVAANIARMRQHRF